MITFKPDASAPAVSDLIETALFLGVRGDPPLESTQLRWQVQVALGEEVDLETGDRLDRLGGALFLTTKEPKPEMLPDQTPVVIGWLRWIAEAGRRSFQIQLSISRLGFDRICGLAEQGKYPHAILTFADEGAVEEAGGTHVGRKIWNNVASKIALISEYTFRYDFASDPGSKHGI